MSDKRSPDVPPHGCLACSEIPDPPCTLCQSVFDKAYSEEANLRRIQERQAVNYQRREARSVY